MRQGHGVHRLLPVVAYFVPGPWDISWFSCPPQTQQPSRQLPLRGREGMISSRLRPLRQSTDHALRSRSFFFFSVAFGTPWCDGPVRANGWAPCARRSDRPKQDFRVVILDGDCRTDRRYLEIRASSCAERAQLNWWSEATVRLRALTITTPCARAPRCYAEPDAGSSRPQALIQRHKRLTEFFVIFVSFVVQILFVFPRFSTHTWSR